MSAYYYINLYKADNSWFSPIIRYCTNWITKKDFFVIVFFWLPAFWLNLRHVKQHTFNTPHGAAFLLRLSEHRLKALGEVLGHLEDTHAWCPSSGQHYNIAALFSSCRQLHAVKLSSWPGVSTRLYKSMHHEDRETQPKFGKKTDMWICGEGWLGRRTDGKHEDEGRRKEAWHTGKKVNLHYGKKRPRAEVEPSLHSPACRNSGEKEAGDTWWGCACSPPVTRLRRLKTAWHFFKSAEDSLDILANSSLQ